MQSISQHTQLQSIQDEDVGFKLEKNRLAKPKYWNKKFTKNMVLPPQLSDQPVDSRNADQMAQNTTDSLRVAATQLFGLQTATSTIPQTARESDCPSSRNQKIKPLDSVEQR